MIINKVIIFCMLTLISFSGCKSPNQPANIGSSASGEWLIPTNQVFDGGPGKDGIPAISDPEMIESSSGSYLSDNELVIGIKIGDEARAYPHQILDWHEIVNDEMGSSVYSVTYCPLTGSAIGWNRSLNGASTTFGVSGLLYNTNLIPYDRATDSNWSQMGLKCVNGELAGQEISLYHVIETTWGTWKKMAPNTQVQSKSTGFNSPYGRYPYGDYKTNNDKLLFPITNDDSRMGRKERVLGIIDGNFTKAYKIAALAGGIQVMNEKFNATPFVVIGSSSLNFAVAYDRKTTDGKILSFEPVQNALPVVMKDAQGSTWDVFGRAIDGPRKGQQLKAAKSFISYWFAWSAFYPNAKVYK